MENKIAPIFNELTDVESIKNHVDSLSPSFNYSIHENILNQLLTQFENLDFSILAYPQLIDKRKKLSSIESQILKKDLKKETSQELKFDRDKIEKELKSFKVDVKHLLVLSIENTLNVAENNKWNICKNHDFIYLYNGSYWSDVDKESFQKFLGEAAEKMGVTKFNARHYQFREQLFKQFIATAYLSTPIAKNDVVLINLLNGTFEISPSGNKLRPFDSSDFITYQLPFNYKPSAKANLFQSYLNKVLPDIERQNVLAEFLAYTFIKHTSNTLKEEKALILYGTGANGKSVFFDIVTALMGSKNVSNYTLQNLTEEKGFYRAKIANKLLNYCSDISTKLEVALFKQLVSGEPVEACLKYGQPFTMNDYAKFIFNCNELPKDIEHTNAYFRRFLIIPFDVTIPEAEQDKQLSYKIIQNELDGVFNWILEGLRRLLTQKKFSFCSAAEKALEQYKTESNSVKQFIDESGYEASSDKYELIKNLYLEYKSFCFEDGLKPFGKRNFIKQLENLNYVMSRQSGTGQKNVFITKENIPF